MDVQKYINKFTGKTAGSLLLILAAALSLWLFIAAGYRKKEVEEISKSLITINSYKISQVAAWREEHSREALRLSRHTVFGGVVAEEIAHPGSRRAELNTWLKDQLIQKQYVSLAFLSPKGAVVSATPGFKAGAAKYFKEIFAHAAREGTGLLTDLYLAADGRPRIAMIIPMSIKGHGGKPVTVLVINIDPEVTFYPIVKTAPQFLTSAETLLVRKEGKRILYLSPLDHAKDAALKFTRPVSDEQLPAAAAIRGVKGFFPGVDYRGVKVFSAIGPVPGSDWAVITKIDRAIILAPVKTREHLALLLILSGAGLIYFTVYSILRARRRAAEAALAEAAKKHEIHFKTTLDSMLEGCMVIGFDWTYIYLNETAARHGRNKQENLLGRTMLEMYPGIEDTPVFAHYKDCMEKRVPERFEESFTFPDGATLWFSFSVAPVPEGIFVLSLDITERRKTELELQSLNRDLTIKKQEMENFLYITTHDLRSPLVNIQGFTQNLVRYIQELRDGLAPEKLPAPVNETAAKLAGEKIPEALKYVLESSRKMDSLISSLLKVARLGRVEMKPETLDMNDLVKKITESVRFQGEKAGVSIKAGVLPPCRADRTAVSQIFANLLGNAIKYRDGARTLEISVTGEVKDARVRYTVADNGSGIAAKDLPRIWDLFFRGGTPGMEGEGIGLTVVKYMAEKNGGSVKAESVEGQGSVFCLDLPAAGVTK